MIAVLSLLAFTILSLVNPITAGLLILIEALVYFCIACGLFVNDVFWIFKFLAMKLLPSIIENPNSLLFLNLPNPGDSYVIPIVAPLVGLLITYIGVVLYDFIVEQQDKKFLKRRDLVISKLNNKFNKINSI